MNDIYFFKDYLTDRFGHPLYRVPIDLSLSCPNRKNGGKGCFFCAEDGARARHLKANLDIKKQVESGVEYIKKRYNAKAPYIAYFQSYTNTNDDLEKLKQYYEEALSVDDFAIVIIATRADCLPNDVVEYLAELNQKYEVWVELGVQTSNDKTLELINRQHDFAAVKDAVLRLDAKGIKSAAHVILGLPGESFQEFKQTAEDITSLPFSGVKIHNLLVLKKTPLARMYSEEPFLVFNEYEYAAALVYFLKKLPESWAVMRITADAPLNKVIAPRWWMKKGQFIEFTKELMQKNISSEDLKNFNTIPKTKTDDGSYTFYHPEYKQHFHTLAGAQTEAVKKFLEPCKIKEKLHEGSKLKILDVGFGLGYNAISVIKEAIKSANGYVDIVSLEQDLKTLSAAMTIFSQGSLEYRVIEALVRDGCWKSEYAKISIVSGDARNNIKKLNGEFDCVFLDGFSPEKNPELWSYDLFREVCREISSTGIIVTYSSAYPVRSALVRCNLIVGETVAFGRRKGGTIASPILENIEQPLSEKDMNIITKSTTGLSYRDPGLNKKRKKILTLRKKTVDRLRSKGVPKWYK